MPPFLVTPESRAAAAAVRGLAARLAARPVRPVVRPVVLCGPPGTGKSHLADWLAERAAAAGADVLRLAAVEIDFRDFDGFNEDVFMRARTCDLLTVEDLQHLDLRAAGRLERWLDERIAFRSATLLTTAIGPAKLTDWPPRLTSRLAAGLVVGLQLPGPASRRRLVRRLAEQERVALTAEAVAWVAAHTPGGVRPLQGALAALKPTARESAVPLEPADVAHVLAEASSAALPTLPRIADRVARHFATEPRRLRGRARRPGALWPVQVGIYLARQLTSHSLAKIGDHFGGRDASTARHACRKVEARAAADPGLAAALHQLRSELG